MSVEQKADQSCLSLGAVRPSATATAERPKSTVEGKPAGKREAMSIV